MFACFHRKLKRLHVSLDDDLHKAAKLFSTYMDVTVNQVMTAAIIHYLHTQTDYSINKHLAEEIMRLTKMGETTKKDVAPKSLS